MSAEQNRLLYLRWLSRANPQLFAMALAAGNSGLADVEEGLGGWVDTIVSAVVTVGGAVLQKKQLDAQVSLQRAKIAADSAASEQSRNNQLQLALLQTNTQRAQAGLPPVDINGRVIASGTLPQLPMTAGVPGMYSASYSPSFLESVPTWAYFAAGGLVLFLIVKR